MYSAFSLISTRGEKAGAPSSGNSLIRLPLSRDGQGKIIGEKLERQTQFGRAIVRSEFGHEIIRRLAFARLFLHNPDIVVLDEATSALDANGQDKMMEALIKELPGDFG